MAFGTSRVELTLNANLLSEQGGVPARGDAADPATKRKSAARVRPISMVET
jgi:hypothetical protein